MEMLPWPRARRAAFWGRVTRALMMTRFSSTGMGWRGTKLDFSLIVFTVSTGRRGWTLAIAQEGVTKHKLNMSNAVCRAIQSTTIAIRYSGEKASEFQAIGGCGGAVGDHGGA